MQMISMKFDSETDHKAELAEAEPLGSIESPWA